MTMAAELTDLSHWEKYWEGFVPERFDSHKIDPLVDQLPTDLTSLEIGGFPGQISAYLRMKKNFDISILDFYADQDLVTKTEQTFGLEPGCIKCTTSDFFDHQVQEKYNLVHSHGFIEHFEDTRDILARHLELTTAGGYVMVTMPNLRNSFYGWLVNRYDRDLYLTHHVKIMDPEYLAECCRDLEVKDFEIMFIGKPGHFWLPDGRAGRAQMLCFKLIRKFLGFAFRGTKNQRLSPGIGILIRT
jgi:2-polyprenyl-3-methyl-5-hydroxy-6-metoxy-1,4-benzoquinol methylase